MTEDIAGLLDLPEGKLAKEARELVRLHEDPSLYNHSVRSYIFARVAAAARNLRPDSDFDADVVYLACVLHDIGLTPRGDRKQRYEVDGADVAAELLTTLGLEPHRIETVWTAIALHTSFGINNRMRPEIALTAAGIAMDFGIEADPVGDQLAEAIHTAYPRLEITRVFVDTVVAQADQHPEKAPPYTFPGELVRERHEGSVTRSEQGAKASRWGS